MTIGAILAGAALIILVAAYLAWPFLASDTADASSTATDTAHRRLLAQKEAILEQIRLLEFDHTTGKIPTEAYEFERQHLLVEAAQVMKQFDQEVTAVLGNDSLDARIEAAVAQLRGKSAAETAVIACPNCTEPVRSGDKFCAACGHQLTPIPEATS